MYSPPSTPPIQPIIILLAIQIEHIQIIYFKSMGKFEPYTFPDFQIIHHQSSTQPNLHNEFKF